VGDGCIRADLRLSCGSVENRHEVFSKIICVAACCVVSVIICHLTFVKHWSLTYTYKYIHAFICL
jgi:hypothetical protein